MIENSLIFRHTKKKKKKIAVVRRRRRRRGQRARYRSIRILTPR